MPAGRQAVALAAALALALALPTSALPLALGAFPKVDYKLKALVIAALSQQLAGGWRRKTVVGSHQSDAGNQASVIEQPHSWHPQRLAFGMAGIFISFAMGWCGLKWSVECRRGVAKVGGTSLFWHPRIFSHITGQIRGDAGVKQVWHLSLTAAAAEAFELMLPGRATHSCGNCWERAAHYLICQYIVQPESLIPTN